MMKWFSVFIGLMAAALTVAGQSQSDWIRYQSPEGRYTVSVPQEPKISSQDRTSPTGEKLPQYLASATEGNGLFLVGYFDYSSDLVFSLEKARDSMVESMKSTLLTDEAISLGSVPGRAIKFFTKANEGTEVVDRVRFFDINRRVYVLQCIFPKAEDGPALVEKCNKFADSFKVMSK